MSTYYHNQLILNKGDKATALYKLTQGSVTLLDQQDSPFASFTAPYLLNLTEILLSVPSLKTARANGKCHILKIKVK
jgi:hypothetical protein